MANCGEPRAKAHWRVVRAKIDLGSLPRLTGVAFIASVIFVTTGCNRSNQNATSSGLAAMFGVRSGTMQPPVGLAEDCAVTFVNGGAIGVKIGDLQEAMTEKGKSPADWRRAGDDWVLVVHNHDELTGERSDTQLVLTPSDAAPSQCNGHASLALTRIHDGDHDLSQAFIFQLLYKLALTKASADWIAEDDARRRQQAQAQGLTVDQMQAQKDIQTCRGATEVAVSNVKCPTDAMVSTGVPESQWRGALAPNTNAGAPQRLAGAATGGLSVTPSSRSDTPLTSSDRASKADANTTALEITNPDWLEKPSADDLVEFYPEAAEREHISGRATIRCQVQASGRLNGCEVVSETPSDAGFGEATIRAARRFRMRPRLIDGQPVSGALVTIPVNWGSPS